MSELNPIPDVSQLLAEIRAVKEQINELASHLKAPTDPPIVFQINNFVNIRLSPYAIIIFIIPPKKLRDTTEKIVYK